MKTLITPQQVIRHAFGGHPTLPLDAVSEGDIAAAEARYLVPVLGEALYERLIEGAYEEFRRDYLVCCTALFTRCMVQPRLDLRTNALGTIAPKSDQGTAPDMAVLRRLRHNLRNEAVTLLRRAVRHLETHRVSFPEYDAHENLSNRCTTDGGFVQIR